MLKNDVLERAKAVFDTEIRGLTAVRESLNESFAGLVELSLETLRNGGKLVLTGIGKSGHIGQKIAATLSSTGSKAVFMHPVEAMHGDLGMLDDKDLLLLLSYSGETEEVLEVLPAAKRLGVKLVAVTGSEDSRLVQWCDVHVPAGVPSEACPFNLAPTASTTALLALGDALAMVILNEKDFGKTDYARLHPAGTIGRSITLSIRDVMRTNERFPAAPGDTPVQEALSIMTRARSGCVVVTDEDGCLEGIFTDGDFRRHISDDPNTLYKPLRDLATPDPVTIGAEALAVELLTLLEGRNIDDVVVVDDGGRAVGLVDSQDLPRFKLM